MATISLDISDAALLVVTSYARHRGVTAETIIADQGINGAIRNAYANGIQRLVESGNIPESVHARMRVNFAAVWSVLGNEYDRVADVDAETAQAIAALV